MQKQGKLNCLMNVFTLSSIQSSFTEVKETRNTFQVAEIRELDCLNFLKPMSDFFKCLNALRKCLSCLKCFYFYYILLYPSINGDVVVNKPIILSFQVHFCSLPMWVNIWDFGCIMSHCINQLTND